MAIDGVIVDVDTTWTLAAVAEYYGKNFSQYTQLTTENVAGMTTDAIIDALSSKIGAIVTPGFAADDTAFKGNVTVLENAVKLSKITVDTNETYGTDNEYNMYIIISTDNKIVAWVEEGEQVAGTATLTGWTEGGETNDDIKAKAPTVRWTDNGDGTKKYSCFWDNEEFTNKDGNYLFTIDGSIDMSGNWTAIGESYDGIQTNWTINGAIITVVRDGLEDIVFTYEF